MSLCIDKCEINKYCYLDNGKCYIVNKDKNPRGLKQKQKEKKEILIVNNDYKIFGTQTQINNHILELNKISKYTSKKSTSYKSNIYIYPGYKLLLELLDSIYE